MSAEGRLIFICRVTRTSGSHVKKNMQNIAAYWIFNSDHQTGKSTPKGEYATALEALLAEASVPKYKGVRVFRSFLWAWGVFCVKI